MRKFYVLIGLAICMLVNFEDALAQRRDNYRGDISKFRGFRQKFANQNKYLSLGISVNAMNYFGDLAPKSGILSTDLSLTRPGFGIVGSYRIGPRVSIRGTFTYARITGDDSQSADPDDDEAVYRFVRNLHFRNDIKELAAVATVDLFKHNRSYISRLPWTPYAFGGIAVFHHNPKAKVPDGEPQGGQWVELHPLGTEGQYVDELDVDTYSKIQIAIPIGIGIRYRLSQNFDMAVEVGYRHLFFDHLDDVGGDYIDKNRFGDDQLAKVMSDRSEEIVAPYHPYESPHGANYQVVPGYGHENGTGTPNIRGNSNDNDIYIVTSVQLTYVFGPRTFRRAKFR